MGNFDFDVIAFLSAGKDNAAVVIFLIRVLTYLAGRFGAKGRVQLGISNARDTCLLFLTKL